MQRLLLPLLLLLTTLAAEIVDGVAILVKQEPITLHDIREAMKKDGTDIQTTLDTLIRTRLEAQEAKERKIKVTKEEVYEELEKMAEQNDLNVQQLFDAMQSARGLSSTELKAKVRERLLNQKLYSAIAFSHMDPPTKEEEEEYYRMHQSEFSHPDSFRLTVYRAHDKSRLQEKINNPMFYAPDVQSEEVTLYYDKINPRLAKILEETPVNDFTPVLPDRQGSLSFFVHEKSMPETASIDSVREEIANTMMGERRNQVLNDYFARLRLNADIQVLRLPE